MMIVYARNKSATVELLGPAGKLAGWSLFNGTAALAFVQFFDTDDVSEITLGTSVPKLVLAIPPVAVGGLNQLMSSFDGIEFQRGCAFAATTEDNNNTAPSWGAGTDTGDFNLFFQ